MVRDKCTVSTARDRAGELPIPPIPHKHCSSGPDCFLSRVLCLCLLPPRVPPLWEDTAGPPLQPAAPLSSAGGEARGRSPALARPLGARKGVAEQVLAGDSGGPGAIIPGVQNPGTSHCPGQAKTGCGGQ